MLPAAGPHQIPPPSSLDEAVKVLESHPALVEVQAPVVIGSGVGTAAASHSGPGFDGAKPASAKAGQLHLRCDLTSTRRLGETDVLFILLGDIASAPKSNDIILSGIPGLILDLLESKRVSPQHKFTPHSAIAPTSALAAKTDKVAESPTFLPSMLSMAAPRPTVALKRHAFPLHRVLAPPPPPPPPSSDLTVHLATAAQPPSVTPVELVPHPTLASIPEGGMVSAQTSVRARGSPTPELHSITSERFAWPQAEEFPRHMQSLGFRHHVRSVSERGFPRPSSFASFTSLASDRDLSQLGISGPSTERQQAVRQLPAGSGSAPAVHALPSQHAQGELPTEAQRSPELEGSGFGGFAGEPAPPEHLDSPPVDIKGHIIVILDDKLDRAPLFLYAVRQVSDRDIVILSRSDPAPLLDALAELQPVPSMDRSRHDGSIVAGIGQQAPPPTPAETTKISPGGGSQRERAGSSPASAPAPQQGDISQSETFDRPNLRRSRLFFLRGDSLSARDLRRARLKTAARVIIFNIPPARRAMDSPLIESGSVDAEPSGVVDSANEAGGPAGGEATAATFGRAEGVAFEYELESAADARAVLTTVYIESRLARSHPALVSSMTTEIASNASVR